jgi:hypothetical protein
LYCICWNWELSVVVNIYWIWLKLADDSVINIGIDWLELVDDWCCNIRLDWLKLVVERSYKYCIGLVELADERCRKYLLDWLKLTDEHCCKYCVGLVETEWYLQCRGVTTLVLIYYNGFYNIFMIPQLPCWNKFLICTLLHVVLTWF